MDSSGGGAHSLPLILAREFASNVSIPVFLVDADNELVFYNEAAQVAFGDRFTQPGTVRHGDWGQRFQPTRRDGAPYPREELPMVVALEQRRPAHAELQVTAPSGERVDVAMTAVPLWSSPEEFAGVLVVGWPIA